MSTTDLHNFVEVGLPTCAFMHGRPDVPADRMRSSFTAFVREHAFSDESEVLVAEDANGHYAGQLWLHTTRNRFNGRRELWVWDITVRDDFRGQGLGKQLFDLAIQRARETRLEELWLLVSSINHVAIRLYRSAGLRSLGNLMCLPVSRPIRHDKNIQIHATILRPLASNDAEALHDLWSAAQLPFRPNGRDSLGRLRTFLNGPEDAGWCASDDEGRLRGAALISSDGRKGWIERLAVHPNHRGIGIARAIVSASINSLRERGLLVIGALIDGENRASRELFAASGFEHREHICYYTFRESHEH